MNILKSVLLSMVFVTGSVVASDHPMLGVDAERLAVHINASCEMNIQRQDDLLHNNGQQRMDDAEYFKRYDSCVKDSIEWLTRTK